MHIVSGAHPHRVLLSDSLECSKCLQTAFKNATANWCCGAVVLWC